MRLSVPFVAILLAGPAFAQVDLSQWPAAEHPAGDYETAIAVFNAGNPVAGGCLFYRGQYRFRVHLAARPDLSPSGEPALMASLNETVGLQINEWLGGDPDDWVAAMDCAIAWAQGEDDPYTPKAEFPAAHAEVLAGLVGLRDGVASDPEAIRAQRTANGLPNR